MIGKKSAPEKPADSISTLIGADTEIEGDIRFSGGLRVDGKVVGRIQADGAGSSTLVVGESGKVEGDLRAAHVIIDGNVRGSIAAQGQIGLQAHALVTGDLSCRSIDMALGSRLNGKLICDPGRGGATTSTTKTTESGS